MGVELGDIVIKKEIEFSELNGKTVGVDAFNTLYQFLSIIRQKDGTPLMDSKGNITSHLSGLFYRNIRLMDEGIRLVYVFDGKPPSWKEQTVSERAETKRNAMEKWAKALKEGRLDEARKYAQATGKVTPEIVEESKELLNAMGIPCIQAISEGEAEVAYLVSKGRLDYAASQDYDSLLFGAPVLLRNLTVSGRRKLPGRDRYVEVHPEVIMLKDTLDMLGIDRRKLIWIGLLTGTDFNEGVKGIGPKKGLKLVKECTTLKEVHEKSMAPEDYELWKSIEEFFLNPEVSDANIVFGKMDKEKVMDILCKRHDFSEERISTTIDEYIKKTAETSGQEKLGRWF
ncbi:MAG: flap endonuclease-1 [Candidatus Micrarchaeia archaeon]